jgi:AcrR family transcriptional regulator
MSKSNPATGKSAVPPAPKPKRPRGRPPQLSKQKIVDKAMELLATQSADDLSLAAVAEALALPTMSLYYHFPNLKTLLEAVADHAFSLFKAPKPRAQQSWQELSLAWLWALQRHCERYPVTLKIIAVEGQPSPAWMRVRAPMLRLLQSLGLDGPALAFASNWFINQAVGLILLEQAAHFGRQSFAQNPLLELDEEDREIYRVLQQHLPKIRRDDALEFGFKATIQTLERLVAESSSAPAPGTAGRRRAK